MRQHHGQNREKSSTLWLIFWNKPEGILAVPGIVYRLKRDESFTMCARLWRNSSTPPTLLRIIFTANATHAINLCLYGILRPGDHVVTSSMEHNNVMRLLRDLESKGTNLSVVPCSKNGSIDPDAVSQTMRPSKGLQGPQGTGRLVIGHSVRAILNSANVEISSIHEMHQTPFVSGNRGTISVCGSKFIHDPCCHRYRSGSHPS